MASNEHFRRMFLPHTNASSGSARTGPPLLDLLRVFTRLMNQIRNRTVDQGAAGRCGRFLKKRSCVEGTFFESVHCLPYEDSRLNNGKRSEGSGSPAFDHRLGSQDFKGEKKQKGIAHRISQWAIPND